MRQYDLRESTKENFEKKRGYYYENSNGSVIDLNRQPFLGVISNDLLAYKWDYVTQGQAIQKIVKFEKAMKVKKFHVVVSGDMYEKYLGNLELFLQRTDVDINNLKMGKLWVDDYYLEGYIIASGKPKRVLGTNKTLLECSIVCENANWQSEETYTFYPNNRNDDVEHNDQTSFGRYYPYDYSNNGYDYASPFIKNSITNESYFDTEFEITISGVADNPEVTIGGNLYKVYTALAAGDYLTINSKKKTAIVTRQRGTKVNVFNNRERSHNLFKKISSGKSLVLRAEGQENTTISIKLFYERSEPKYTETKWI